MENVSNASAFFLIRVHARFAFPRTTNSGPRLPGERSEPCNLVIINIIITVVVETLLVCMRQLSAFVCVRSSLCVCLIA